MVARWDIVKILQLIQRACRLPKEGFERGRSYAARLERSGFRIGRYWGKREWSVVIIAFVVFTQLPSIWSLNHVIPAESRIELDTEITEPAFATTTYTETPGMTSAVLLNSSPFNPQDQGSITASYELENHVSHGQDGYELEIPYASQVVEIQFSNYLENGTCTGVVGQARLRVVEGEAELGLALWYGDITELNRNVTTLTSGESAIITVPVDGLTLRQAANTWLEELTTKMWITSTNSTTKIIIESLSVEATFSKTLYPATLVVRTSEGDSFLDDPNVMYMESFPCLSITRDDANATYALLHIRRTTNTFYLDPGNYSGFTGFWFYNEAWLNSSRVATNFAIRAGDASVIDVGLIVPKVSLALSPRFLFKKIHVDAYGEDEYDRQVWETIYDLPIRNFTALYIPHFSDHLEIILLNPFSPVAPYSPSQAIWPERIEARAFLAEGTNSAYNLRFKVVLPAVTVLGVMLGLGDVVLLSLVGYCFVVIALLVWKMIGTRRLHDVVVDSRFPPILLLVLSIFVPWMTYFDDRGYLIAVGQFGLPSPATYVIWSVIPLGLVWKESYAAQFFEPIEWTWLTLVSLITFIIPLLFAISRLGLYEEEEEGARRDFALLMALPYILVIVAAIIAYNHEAVISLGAVLAMMALPVWLVSRFMMKRNIT